MNKNLVLAGFALTCFGLFSFIILSKSGKAGYTGSPGENSCNQCHNTYPLNSGDGGISIRTDMIGDLYEPDSTYTIQITVHKPGVNLFGFGCEALKSGNTNAGLFTVTDATHTQLLTASNGRKNMTHRLNGGAFADSAIFTFNWTAPSTNVGTIHFYFTGVCANGNNANSLDYVYKSSYAVTSLSTAAVEAEQSIYSDFEIRPFPTGEFVDIGFVLNTNANLRFDLLTMDGKTVQTVIYENEERGDKLFTLHTNELNAGIYILNVAVNDTYLSRKFMLMK